MRRISKCLLDWNRGCINYNPVLAIRQLGYPMRGAPSEESITPFVTWGFSDPNTRVFKESARHVMRHKGRTKSLGEAVMGSLAAIISG